MRIRVWRSACLMLAFMIPAFALGQVPAGVTATKEPVGPSGVQATCDLPPGQHMKNTGGSDGYGLCVFTSGEIASRWMNIPELAGFQTWMTRHQGGGWPDKLDQMVAAFCKERGVAVPQYVQHTGGDDAFLDAAMKTDRMLCVTYAGMDGFYRDRFGRDIWIDHMVCLAHLDQEWAAIIDNNRPGYWVWMKRKDFLVRWRARGGGWAVAFLGPPPPPHLPAGGGVAVKACCPCGPGCQCPPGECPACCAGTGVFGQCGPNGCPLRQPTLITPFTPTAPAVATEPVAVEKLPLPTRPPFAHEVGPTNNFLWRDVPGVGPAWIENMQTHDWGVTPAGRWGWVPKPAAARPAVKQQAAPAGQDDDGEHTNFGLDRSKIHQRPTYSIAGVQVTRDEAHAAMAGGTLADDSDRWHLTAVGDSAFLSRFRMDVAAMPTDVRAKLHVQAYPPDAWPVTLYNLPVGVSLRKPSPARTAEQVGAVPAVDYSAAKLGDLLGPVTGKAPPAPPKPPPAPAPGPDVKPAPTPDPEPAPPADRSGLLALVVAALALVFGVFRR